MRNATLLALSFLSAVLPAHALELKECSFADKEAHNVFQVCVSSAIAGKTYEFGYYDWKKTEKLSGGRYLIRSEGAPDRFLFDRDCWLGVLGNRIPFLVDEKTLAVVSDSMLEFFNIPALSSLKEGDNVIELGYGTSLSRFGILNSADYQLRARNEELLKMFDLDRKGLLMRTSLEETVVRINPRVDKEWVKAAYVKHALLENAEQRKRNAEIMCAYQYKWARRIAACRSKVAAKYQDALAKINAGLPQTFTRPFEDTADARFLETAMPVHDLILIADATSADPAKQKAIVSIHNPGGGRNARLDLPKANPYLFVETLGTH